MSKNMRIGRRNFFCAIAGVGASGAVYARFVEPKWLAITQVEVRLEPDAKRPPLKILQLSDLHASDVVSLDFIRSAVQAGLALQPDLICLTGDFITGRYDRTAEYAEILAVLSKQAPSFGILGNHDGGTWATGYGGYSDTAVVRRLLVDSGITLLHNAARTFEIRGRKLQLAGLGDSWSRECEPEKVLPSLSRDAPVILMSHNPDTKDLLRHYRWDLMLSGHTHGGQLRMPVVGAPFAPVRDKRYLQGLHLWEGHWLHITKGVGNLHGLRFNCRPEISLLTII